MDKKRLISFRLEQADETIQDVQLLIENDRWRSAESGFDGITAKYKPHYLKGIYKDCCECHVKNDLLLIWREKENPNVIVLVRAGTHSDLF